MASAPDVPLGAGTFWFDGDRSAGAYEGNYTATSNLTDGSEGDLTTGVTSSGDIATLLNRQSVAAAPAQVTLVVEYAGDLNTPVYGSNDDGETWTEIADVSGGSWPTNGSPTAQQRTLIFAHGSTEYDLIRVKVDATSGTLVITDFRVFTAYVLVNASNVRFNWQAVRDVYTDTACTTALVTEGGRVRGWKNLQSSAANNATQGTDANRPILRRSVAELGGRAAFQLSDNPLSAAEAYWLDSSAALSAAMDSGMTLLVVHYRDSSINNAARILGIGGEIFWNLQLTAQNLTSTAQFGTAAPMRRATINKGVLGMRWNGSRHAVYCDKQLRSLACSAIGFSNHSLRIGNDDGTTTNSHRGYISMVLGWTVALTDAQIEAEIDKINLHYGRSVVTQLIACGNSITEGTGAYNNPWPSQFNDYANPDFGIKRSAFVGHTTQQRAEDDVDAGKILEHGHGYIGAALTSTGTPTRTTIAVSGAGWTTNEHAGKRIVMTSGATGVKGFGAHIVSNTSDTLTLTGTETPGGLPVAPTVGDQFRIFENYTNGKIISVPWEWTNDLKANGATVGPTAVSSVKNDCLIYVRLRSWCCAHRAYGVKVIAATMIPRNEGGMYANYQTDWGILNGWIRSDYPTFADALADVNTLVQFENVAAIAAYPTHWLDQIHPSNTGGGTLAGYKEDVALTLL